MSKQTDRSFFILSSWPRLYQQLTAGIMSFDELGKLIIEQVKTAQAFRRVEQVRELSGILLNLPIREYQLIGQYYLTWCHCRESKFDSEILERIIEQTNTYKVQALLSRGTFEMYQGSPEHALYFYNEALKASPTASEYISISLAIAVTKATEGFHASALNDMEELIPLISHADPRLYYDFLNSYAVELYATGRLHEAQNVSHVTVSSPFARFYPEWQQTHADIYSKRKNRSTVHIRIKEQPDTGGLEQSPMSQDEIDTELAQMFDEEFVPGYPQPFHPDITEAVTSFDELAIRYGPQALLAVLLRMVLGHRINEKEIQVICDVFYNEDEAVNLNPQIKQSPDAYHSSLTYAPDPIEKVLPVDEGKKNRKRINLDSVSYLEKVVINWCNQEITPEQLAEVMSAIRDCKDDLRRTNIIDRIIEIAFLQSNKGNQTEAEWRSEHEAGLDPPDYESAD